MKQATTIFGREHLNVSKDIQDKILKSYNQHDNLVNTMRLTASNLRDIAISVGKDHKCFSAIHDLADRLHNATIQF